MNDIAIRAENLGKEYRIGQRESAYRTLRESIMSLFSQRDGKTEKIWALKDISFEVKRGEVIGIIGRNGAGKSTLLKILSQITEPTEGHAYINGRVGSLLEVGTGFHPELTGRENIYLNGAILGMRRAEIRSKFDEIVAFAEIERFIDTPVKRYSSGMYVRLAFAVAAHLEPEILLVDEVLAVGDIQFQRKCLGKMDSVAKTGRTVLFVSHNMAMVKKLCQNGIVLEAGKIIYMGDAADAINEYLNSSDSPGNSEDGVLVVKRESFKKVGRIYITDIKAMDMNDSELKFLHTGDTLKLRVFFRAEERISAPSFKIAFWADSGFELLRLSTEPISGFPISSIEGEGYIECIIPRLPFTGGRYEIDVGVAIARIGLLQELQRIATLFVGPGDFYSSGFALSQKFGFITAPHYWHIHNPASDDKKTMV